MTPIRHGRDRLAFVDDCSRRAGDFIDDLRDLFAALRIEIHAVL